jgi:AmpD protein
MSGWRAEGWLEGVEWLASPNFGERPPEEAVSLIVVHNISLPPDEFGGAWVERFFLNQLDPQGHPYFATIAGRRFRRISMSGATGGSSSSSAATGVPGMPGRHSGADAGTAMTISLGIELEGSDSQPFAPVQYAALWGLIDALRTRYPIAAIAGHCHVAPGRKTDPGPCFDWAAVRERYPLLELPAEVAV